MKIYHIMTPEQWEAFEGRERYRAPSLAEEGFIHCSFADQVDDVLARYFKGQPSVIIVEIEPAKLTSKLVAELSTDDEEYPHIYGELNREAVTGFEERRLRP